jgi:hypothetical protein
VKKRPNYLRFKEELEENRENWLHEINIIHQIICPAGQISAWIIMNRNIIDYRKTKRMQQIGIRLCEKNKCIRTDCVSALEQQTNQNNGPMLLISLNGKMKKEPEIELKNMKNIKIGVMKNKRI